MRMMEKTRVCDILNIKYPVIQAAMVWISGAELVAAVSNAGGMGILGPNAGAKTVTLDVVETGERLRREIRRVRNLTEKAFGVNIVLPFPGTPQLSKEFSDETVKVAIEEKVPVVQLVGEGGEDYIHLLKKAGIRVVYRCMPVNLRLAKRVEEAGVDCIIVVGLEGGGHSGIDKLSTFVLVPEIAEALKIPVIAGGGIVNGRGMAAAFALGAEGVYLGTRFIATNECAAHPNVKKAIVEAIDTSTATCITTVGVARALCNPLLQRCIQLQAVGGSKIEVTTQFRGSFLRGLVEGDMQEGSILMGEGAGMIPDIKSAAAVVREIVKDAERVMAGMSNFVKTR
jgi:NAD(P)H-dependent flavin oxidoreductase YrpB (nitropropane dioxygenase family)